MSFLVNDKQWASLSDADKQAIVDFWLNKFHLMETEAKIITLPSGKEFIFFCNLPTIPKEGGE